MSKEKIKNNDFLFETITINDNEKTALLTKNSNKSFIKTNFNELKKSRGYIQKKDGSLQEWHIEANTNRDNQLIMYGPYIPVEHLPYDYCPDRDEFIKLKEFMYKLSQKDMDFTFSPIHFAKHKDGGFIALPPKVINEIVSIRFGNDHPAIERYSHPDLTPEQNNSYALGLMQFQIFTGIYPWNEEETEPLHEEIRERRIPGLKDYFGETDDPELLQHIDEAVNGGYSMPDIEWWKDMQPLGKADKNQEWEKAMEKSYSFFTKKRYIRKNPLKITLTALSVFLAIMIISGTIIKITKEPITDGMNRRDVVSYYYDALSELNYEVFSEVCRRDRFSDPQKIASNYYITYKASSITPSQRKRHITPETLIEDERESLFPDEIIYGITDLKIDNYKDEKFEAEYILWQTPERESYNQNLKPVKYRIKDIITLKSKGDDWLIKDVETVSRELLPETEKE